MSALRVLYQLLYAFALLAWVPLAVLRRGRAALGSLALRLLPQPGGSAADPCWIHAVSVGEVGVARTLVRELPADLPLLLTTVTPTGQERARSSLGERLAVTYLPFDLAPIVRRFLTVHHPRALVLIEGDYWPVMLSAVRRRHLPVAVVNGRVGDRSFGRWRRLRPLARWLLSHVDRFGVQSAADRERLQALGVAADRITVTGNLKFDASDAEALPLLAQSVTRCAASRPILVAGSTMPGEEDQVLDAFQRIGGGQRALLILAPRHPERCEAVAQLIARMGFCGERRSRLPASSCPDVLLLDTLGELAALYRIAAAVFIGGTLVPTGGHNPLEPAACGRPIAIGPSMENFRDMAEHFDRWVAWRRVAGAVELADAWQSWLDEPTAAAAVGERGRQLVQANRGATRRTIELLQPLLAPTSDDAG